MVCDVPPDLVVFDIDGTLQDTFQWWPRIIRAGQERCAEEWGFDHEPVSDDEACSVIGLADADVWGPFLPPDLRHRWVDFREIVVPLEVEELHRGIDYLFDGVRDLLAWLRHIGVRVALASNCRSRYFAALCDGQGLGDLSDWQFCLDSRGGCNKTQMVEFALEESGSRQAVMVGDRETDMAAARAHALPFVWRASQRFSLEGADAHWHGDPAELLGLLSLPGISWRDGE